MTHEQFKALFNHSAGACGGPPFSWRVGARSAPEVADLSKLKLVEGCVIATFELPKPKPAGAGSRENQIH